ncbi:ras-like GTP-binding protein rhoA [Gigantopelta aegis]|uniref:ras-like GTP-binding protein rhoA n=1 Tax=Gigantopelta aegis TaxID=1735272 RepID=UPI001B88C44A|nr:ras-like GTP-binding protein rhoA [Gigantopelta aegis]XP_041350424.1 ras-like GTP-binding protein rhoA [Gigantopelta aegis]XP_041350425.1 ras-like GTP-binding protein rhoA [Gigantopelta aegis]
MAQTSLKRLVLVGDANCGKTSLVLAFTNNEFRPELLPTVFDHHTVELNIDNTQIFVELRDTSGHEDYDKLRSVSYPNVDVIIMCFAIDNARSLSNILDRWYPEVRQYCPMCPIMLVGTKADTRNDPRTIQRLSSRKQVVLRPEQGRNMKDRIGALVYLECSAKDSNGVKEVFKQAIRLQGTKKSTTRKCSLL